MEERLNVRPCVRFEVEKVIGVSRDGNYQVQWAPAWVSKFHLAGCEHLIEEYLQQQQPQQQQPQKQQQQQQLPEAQVQQRKLGKCQQHLITQSSYRDHSDDPERVLRLSRQLSGQSSRFSPSIVEDETIVERNESAHSHAQDQQNRHTQQNKFHQEFSMYLTPTNFHNSHRSSPVDSHNANTLSEDEANRVHILDEDEHRVKIENEDNETYEDSAVYEIPSAAPPESTHGGYNYGEDHDRDSNPVKKARMDDFRSNRDLNSGEESCQRNVLYEHKVSVVSPFNRESDSNNHFHNHNNGNFNGSATRSYEPQHGPLSDRGANQESTRVLTPTEEYNDENDHHDKRPFMSTDAEHRDNSAPRKHTHRIKPRAYKSKSMKCTSSSKPTTHETIQCDAFDINTAQYGVDGIKRYACTMCDKQFPSRRYFVNYCSQLSSISPILLYIERLVYSPRMLFSFLEYG